MHKGVSILGLLVVLGLCACSRQQSDWEKTRASNTADAYELYLKKYPSGEFTAQANARVRELYEERDWQKARDLDTVEAYQGFLKQYPEGKWSDEARIRVENFTLAAAPSSASPGAAAPPPASSDAVEPSARPAHRSAGKRPSTAVAGSAPGIASGAGKYGIQLGAFRSGEDAANRRWALLSKKYPKLLGGLAPSVVPLKQATATIFRLRVADLSRERAQEICRQLKSKSQSCVVVRPTA